MVTAWAWAVTFFGLLGAVLYAVLTFRARGRATFAQLLVGMSIAGVCAYAGVLWGSQQMGRLKITPEMGRPALALALASLVWMGLLAIAVPRPK